MMQHHHVTADPDLPSNSEPPGDQTEAFETVERAVRSGHRKDILAIIDSLEAERDSICDDFRCDPDFANIPDEDCGLDDFDQAIDLLFERTEQFKD